MVSTKKQLLSIAAVATAIMAYSFATPDSAHAWLFHHYTYPDRAAPEVDPSTISSVVALALGGLAVLGDKLRRR